MTFTEQMILDVGITLGMSEPESLKFYHHYNAQDWFFGSGLKIKNLKSAMWRWKNNGYKEKNGVFGKKQRMFPIPGKICSERGCRMPAVYKDTSGNYDSYRCSVHLPDEVKAKYE
jgi:hypothetical protein